MMKVKLFSMVAGVLMAGCATPEIPPIDAQLGRKARYVADSVRNQVPRRGVTYTHDKSEVFGERHAAELSLDENTKFAIEVETYGTAKPITHDSFFGGELPRTGLTIKLGNEIMNDYGIDGVCDRWSNDSGACEVSRSAHRDQLRKWYERALNMLFEFYDGQ